MSQEAFQRNRDADQFQHQKLNMELDTLTTELLHAKAALEAELPQRTLLESRLRQMHVDLTNEETARCGLPTRKSKIPFAIDMDLPTAFIVRGVI